MNFLKNILEHSNDDNIFKLIDDYNIENNQKLIKYIKRNPECLYNINKSDGLGVYSYATLKNFNCLYDVHETFLKIKRKYYSKFEKKSYKKNPYEIETLIINNTAIHYAAENDLREQAEYLINRINVNINHQNYNLDTPLHVACKFGNRKIIEILLDNKNINLNLLNINLATPLYVASIQKYKKIIQMLLDKGALFEVKHKKTRFIYDTYLKIKEKEDEYSEILKIFDKYKKQRSKDKKFRDIRREYKYLCNTLNDNVIDESIEILAKNLGLSSIENLLKKDLCKKLAERLVIYAQNPEIIKEK